MSNVAILALLVLYFNALLLGGLCLLLAPLFIMMHVGIIWGLVAMYIIWPLAFTIFLL